MQINDLYREADALLNICGSHELNEDLLGSANAWSTSKAIPAWEQIKVDKGKAGTVDFLKRQYTFTFGENIGRPEFPVPLHELHMAGPTRQPVVLKSTGRPPGATAPGSMFTSIANLATGG